MRSFFVTGTDTGAGKTVLTAVLVAAARAAGIDTVPMKPVQTGVPRGRRPVGDLRIVARAAAWRAEPDEADLVSPYRFAPACSPHRAATLAGRPIEFEAILRAFCMLRPRHEALIVEGAGGVLVPVGERRTMLDLMEAMRLPVLVAARPGLGTLNHTMLTCEALRARRLEIAGVVMVQARPGRWSPLMEDNRRTLQRFGVPVLGRLPHMPGFARDPRAACLRALGRPATRWLGPLLRA
jgi:dethiobiotin synthetase